VTNTVEYTLVIHLINVVYVVKYLVRHLTYRHTLEYIQVIHLIHVMYVVKDLVRIVAYRDTFHQYVF
jgi:hypothetical protein